MVMMVYSSCRSAPRGGRQPDRHLLLLRTSAGSSSSRKRCARHTMSIAVCVRVSRQYSMRMCLLPAPCCSAAYTAYRPPPTAYCLLSTAYGPPSDAYCLRLSPTACRLPPAHAHVHAACAAYVPPVLHSAYVHVPLSQE